MRAIFSLGLTRTIRISLFSSLLNIWEEGVSFIEADTVSIILLMSSESPGSPLRALLTISLIKPKSDLARTIGVSPSS